MKKHKNSKISKERHKIDSNFVWSKNGKIDIEKYNKFCEARRKDALKYIHLDGNFGWKPGHIPWNKGLTKETDKRVKEMTKKAGKTYKKRGHIVWNKGLTKEDPRLAKGVEKMTKVIQEQFKNGRKQPWIGKPRSRKYREKLRICRLKQRIPTKDTKIELMMDDALATLHIYKEKDYLTHITVLNLCQPDKVFEKEKIAVFCDGDYWHNLPNYTKRDRKQNKILKKNGWKVLRFWEHKINKFPEKCASIVMEELQNARLGLGTPQI